MVVGGLLLCSLLHLPCVSHCGRLTNRTRHYREEVDQQGIRSYGILRPKQIGTTAAEIREESLKRLSSRSRSRVVKFHFVQQKCRKTSQFYSPTPGMEAPNPPPLPLPASKRKQTPIATSCCVAQRSAASGSSTSYASDMKAERHLSRFGGILQDGRTLEYCLPPNTSGMQFAVHRTRPSACCPPPRRSLRHFSPWKIRHRHWNSRSL